ncbi:prevent-host-death protein [Paludisphaera sp.]|uniref:prevent-host-death protein n=1 Tax=Paludisphaera sp. TaxID=2017432 RepID=UPI00301C79E7
MDLSRDIHPLPDCKRRASEFLDQLQRSGEPVVLTINGEAELVVQDSASYRQLMDIARRADEMESLRVAVEEMKAGKGRPIEAMFAEMEAQLAAAKAKQGG